MHAQDAGPRDEAPPLIVMQPDPVVARRVSRVVHLQRLLFGGALALVASIALGWYASRPAASGARAAAVKTVAAADFHLPPLAWSPARAEPVPAAVDPQPAVSGAEDAGSAVDLGAARSLPVLQRQPGQGLERVGVSEPAADDAPVMWRKHDEAVTAREADPNRQEHALLPAGYSPARAEQLPLGTRVLGKGTAIGCTLETAIDSQLAGLVSCLIGAPVYGVDGREVLMPRGTRLLGETRSEPRTGQSRVFVLWVEARTPDGWLVPLASPATDALGRAGVPGEVDTHFFQRFGAAMLISVLDAGVQAAANHGGGGTVIIAPQTSEAVMTEVLRNTVAIPPTITVRPGAQLSVMVARDVDFGAAPPVRGRP